MNIKNALLEYQLTDALEMNFSKRKETLALVKSILLDRPIQDFNLHHLFSFALEDALVVIRDGSLDAIKSVYFLNSESESYQTGSVQFLHPERRPASETKTVHSFQLKRLDPA